MHEPARQRRERAPVDDLEETRGHPLGQRRLGGLIDPLTHREPHAHRVPDRGAGLLQPNDAAPIVGDQPPADVDDGHRGDLAVAADRKLGRPAADVDIQHGAAPTRARHRPRAVGGHDRLELRARGRADEAAGLPREERQNALGVLFLGRLAGDDDGSRVDVARREARARVGIPDERVHALGVDQDGTAIRREEDRRLREHVALDHPEAARELPREAPQHEA